MKREQSAEIFLGTVERHAYIYIYIYIRRILHSSTISVGLAQARPNNYTSKRYSVGLAYPAARGIGAIGQL